MVKQAWIEWLGPEKIVEPYAGTESLTATVIAGTEWMERRDRWAGPRRPMRVLDPEVEELPPRRGSRVFMQGRRRDTPTYRFVGAKAPPPDGWESWGTSGGSTPRGTCTWPTARTT